MTRLTQNQESRLGKNRAFRKPIRTTGSADSGNAPFSGGMPTVVSLELAIDCVPPMGKLAFKKMFSEENLLNHESQ